MYNVLGQMVSTKKIGNLNQNQGISLKTNTISTGLYFLNVSGKILNHTQKILVIK
jgi:hypothetical protein